MRSLVLFCNFKRSKAISLFYFYFFEAERFSILFKVSPAFHCIFFGNFAFAQSPKKDAVSIGARTSFRFSIHFVKVPNYDKVLKSFSFFSKP